MDKRSFFMYRINKFDPKFWPDIELRSNTDFNDFMTRTGQRLDTGIGFGFIVWKYQLKWKKLLRSNTINDHHLMSGIYEDMIYHVGASSRARKVFQGDLADTWVKKLRYFIVSLPFFWRFADIVEISLLNLFPPTALVHNRKAFKKIEKRLNADPESYYRYLRSQA